MDKHAVLFGVLAGVTAPERMILASSEDVTKSSKTSSKLSSAKLGRDLQCEAVSVVTQPLDQLEAVSCGEGTLVLRRHLEHSHAHVCGRVHARSPKGLRNVKVSVQQTTFIQAFLRQQLPGQSAGPLKLVECERLSPFLEVFERVHPIRMVA